MAMVLCGFVGGMTIFVLRALAKACAGMSTLDVANQTAIRWRLPPVMRRVGSEELLPRIPLRDGDDGLAFFVPRAVIEDPRVVAWHVNSLGRSCSRHTL
jgi:hypothetical protein